MRIWRSKAPQVFKHQAFVTLNQANPVSGTKYEVLATTKNVRVIDIATRCTWTAQPTPLEVHVTVDGQAPIFPFTDPVSNTYYTAIYDITGPTLSATAFNSYRAFLLEGRSVKVEGEITGGTVSNLWCRIFYAKIP